MPVVKRLCIPLTILRLPRKETGLEAVKWQVTSEQTYIDDDNAGDMQLLALLCCEDEVMEEFLPLLAVSMSNHQIPCSENGCNMTCETNGQYTQ